MAQHDLDDGQPGGKGALKPQNPRLEGFWRYTLDPDEDLPWPPMKAEQYLPWPEGDTSWADCDKAAFLESLDRAEAEAERLGVRGYSNCRLCGRDDRADIFMLENWAWPQAFRHYLVEHNVRPSSEFELFISKWI